MSSFGQLRSFLHQAPTREGFEQICALVDALPSDEAQDQAVPYALDHLKRWPLALRRLPQPSLMRWLRGEAAPASLALARWVDLEQRVALATPGESIAQPPAPLNVRADLSKLQLGLMIPLLLGLLESGKLERLHIEHGGYADLDEWSRVSVQATTPLKELRIWRGTLYDDAFTRLAAAETHQELKLLSSQLWELPQSSSMTLSPSLRTLDLSGTTLSEVRQERLAEALSQPDVRLSGLGLSGIRASAASIERVLRAPGARGLSWIGAAQNQLGPSNMLAFFEGEGDWALRYLELQRNPLGTLGLENLIFSDAATALYHLDASKTKLGRSGAKALACCDRFRGIESLGLGANKLQDEGVEALLSAPWLKGLRRVDLSDNGLTDEGVVAMLTSPKLDRLERLELGLNAISGAPLMALADARCLPALQALVIEPKLMMELEREGRLQGRLKQLISA